MAKVMVMSYEQGAHSQFLLQEISHERAGIQSCKRCGEVQREAVVYTGILQQTHLVLGGGEQTRPVIGLEYLARMLWESDGHTLEAALRCNALEALQQVYVTLVDSVKESYRSGVSASVRNGYGHA